MDPLLLLEIPFDLSYKEDVFEVEYLCHDARARVCGVRKVLERAEDGVVTREYGVLLLRDRGRVAELPTVPGVAYVARGKGQVTPLPDSVGDFVGALATEHGLCDWLVFSARQGAPRLARTTPAPSVQDAPEPRGEAPGPQAPEVGGGGESPSVRPPVPQSEEEVWPFHA